MKCQLLICELNLSQLHIFLFKQLLMLIRSGVDLVQQ